MKVPAKSASRFLSKEDLDTETFVVTISEVKIESLRSNRGDEDKYVLYFKERDFKPMVLNVLNRRRIIAVYGDESDDWTGRAIEIYVDPNVEMGGEIVGGIRVKIPASPPSRSSTQPKQPTRQGDAVPQYGSTPRTPAARQIAPATKPRRGPQANTLAGQHAQALEGFRCADTAERADKWWKWTDAIPFDDAARSELTHAYHAALQRIALADDPAAVGAGASEESIPF
jgi:hypothetical protein